MSFDCCNRHVEYTCNKDWASALIFAGALAFGATGTAVAIYTCATGQTAGGTAAASIIGGGIGMGCCGVATKYAINIKSVQKTNAQAEYIPINQQPTTGSGELINTLFINETEKNNCLDCILRLFQSSTSSVTDVGSHVAI